MIVFRQKIVFDSTAITASVCRVMCTEEERDPYVTIRARTPRTNYLARLELA
ncbi:hypothetical protein J6590_019914 [Homalodisca vitripennis]|nr:hypothetical protein J6590_019914 [Homalodisca vitripennis]